MTESLTTQILRLCVYLEQDDEVKEDFIRLSAKVTDWQKLVAKAESSALSNLLYQHIKHCKIDIPKSDTAILRALTARHKRNNRERIDALKEILQQFSEENIQSVLLKGMSLIHTLYEDNSQRPMGDIDILVRETDANRAQSALRKIGYQAADRKTGFGFDHHHLPVATKKINGMAIQVEIHHNALSGDVKDSLSFQEVEPDLIPIDIDKSQTHSLGHRHQLKHLCHHTFEPCEKIKLGAIADIYGYASKYAAQINWEEIKRDEHIIENTLRCIHFMSPLPKSLGQHITPPICSPPTNVGYGFPPLSSTLVKSRTFKDKAYRLFCCSGWWFHVFYQVKPENSLLPTKLFFHPLTIGKWLSRRTMAKVKSNISKK